MAGGIIGVLFSVFSLMQFVFQSDMGAAFGQIWKKATLDSESAGFGCLLCVIWLRGVVAI